MTQTEAIKKAKNLSVENQSVAIVYLDSFYNSYHVCLYEEFTGDEQDVVIAFDNGRQSKIL